MGDANSFRAVERTLAVLSALGQLRKPASVTDVAECTSLNRAATHRILRGLESVGAVSRTRRGYHLGPLIFGLGKRVIIQELIAEAALGPLEELTGQFDEATHASVLSEDEALMVVYCPSFRSASLGRQPGVRKPPYQGAGKILLASVPATDLRKYLANTRLEAATRYTITNPAKLLLELERIRTQGFAINHGEHTDGHTSVGVPIVGFDGEWLAAISISGPSERMASDRIADMIPALKATSTKITQRLFHQPSFSVA